jgi:hypothetical protein
MKQNLPMTNSSLQQAVKLIFFGNKELEGKLSE